MKEAYITSSIFLLILVFCLSPNLFGQDKKTRPTENELISIEMKRSEAIAKHDGDFLDKLYSDDFRGVTATGFEANKETLMTVFKRDDPRTRFHVDQLQARLFGHTAVITGRLIGKAAETGEIVHSSLFMHVYLKRRGRWQIVAGQGTMLPSEHL